MESLIWTVLAMIAAAAGGQSAPDRAELQQIFRMMDVNGDGFLTANEVPRVTQVRGQGVGNVRVQSGSSWVARYDRNGDNRISQSEYVNGSLAEMAAYQG